MEESTNSPLSGRRRGRPPIIKKRIDPEQEIPSEQLSVRRRGRPKKVIEPEIPSEQPENLTP